MKKFLLFCFFVSSISIAKAQTDSEVNGDTTNTGKIFYAVEMEPQFSGGIDHFYLYLQKNIVYPPDAMKKRIEGKVYVSFVVEQDGSLSGVKILRGVSPGIDAEALRVVSRSPKWRPGIQNGRAARAQFSIALTFKLPPPQPIAQVQSRDTVPTDEVDTSSNKKIFAAVEKEPAFPGGIDKFYNYLTKNQKYPDAAKKDNIRGSVVVTFVVERDGSLGNIRVIRSLSLETDVEAVRLMKECPKWEPGTQRGGPVRVQYSIPIAFPVAN